MSICKCKKKEQNTSAFKQTNKQTYILLDLYAFFINTCMCKLHFKNQHFEEKADKIVFLSNTASRLDSEWWSRWSRSSPFNPISLDSFMRCWFTCCLMSDHIILHMQSLVSAASSLFVSQIQYSFRCVIAPPYHITVKTEKDRKSQCWGKSWSTSNLRELWQHKAYIWSVCQKHCYVNLSSE